MTKKRIAITILIFAVVVAMIGIIYIVLKKGNSNDKPDKRDNSNEEEPSMDYVDAEQFYNANSQEVAAVNAKSSGVMLDEKSVYKLLNERGVCGTDITAAYTEDGEYYGEKTIQSDSEEKHPVYQTQYFSDNGDEWLIMVIGKSIMACPITFVCMPGDDIPIVVSETKTVTGYDNISGKFYDTLPKETVLKIVQVECVDAATLDSIAEDAKGNKE